MLFSLDWNVCERAPRLYRPMLNQPRFDSRMNLLCFTCKQQARICSRMLCRRHCHFPLLFPLCSLRAGTRRRGLSRELSSAHPDSHADELFVLYRVRVYLDVVPLLFISNANFLFISSSTRSHKFVFYSHPLRFPLKRNCVNYIALFCPQIRDFDLAHLGHDDAHHRRVSVDWSRICDEFHPKFLIESNRCGV
jgi:hypothetical protein